MQIITPCPRNLGEGQINPRTHVKNPDNNETSFYNASQDSDAYTLREPDVAYNAHFDSKKEGLSIDNGVCLDEKK